MVKIAYHAQEQMKGLTKPERAELVRMLEDGETLTGKARSIDTNRFVARFGATKRVVWSRENDGNLVILSVVDVVSQSPSQY